jgi:endoglucanase
MKRFVFAVVLACWSASSALAAPAKGGIIYQETFEGAGAAKGWSGAPKFEAGHQSAKAVAIVQGNPGANTISRTLPVEAMRGCAVRVSAMVKAENVSAKPNPWNGIKCMLIIEAPDGKQYPQAPLDTGAFDWRRALFTAKIPADATKVSLILGLEQVSGKVWFDDLNITIAKVPPTTVPKPVAGPMFKGHNLPRLRGTMISPNIDEDGLRTLGKDWGANLIRWQLIRILKPGQPSSLADFDKWVDGELKKLDAALPLCEKYGIYVALDLHSPPGGKATVSGYVGSDDSLFTSKAAQDKFVEFWQHTARRYKDTKMIWGYDIANEPVEEMVEEGCDDWPALAERAARAIRAVDPQRAIIVEPAQWGSPDGLRDFVPLGVPNIVYSVHMYIPHQFTHQNVYEQVKPLRYPGEIAGKNWDKAQLELALKPAIEFQKKYNVHLYLGEFSAIRWAPDNSARRYLKDVIELFEKYGWDWSYHAFREWQGWSVEHTEDRANTRRATAPTDREQLLREWFGKNQKPAW